LWPYASFRRAQLAYRCRAGPWMGIMTPFEMYRLLRRIPIARLDAEDGKGFTCIGCGATEQYPCAEDCWANAVENAIDDYERSEPPALVKCQMECSRLQGLLNEALGALGYSVPNDTPCPPRYKCGLCEARNMENRGPGTLEYEIDQVRRAHSYTKWFGA